MVDGRGEGGGREEWNDQKVGWEGWGFGNSNRDTHTGSTTGRRGGGGHAPTVHLVGWPGFGTQTQAGARTHAGAGRRTATRTHTHAAWTRAHRQPPSHAPRPQQITHAPSATKLRAWVPGVGVV